MWYELQLGKIADGGYEVRVPDFPEIKEIGASEKAAVNLGLLAIEEAIARRIAADEDIPAPSDDKNGMAYHVRVPGLILLKSSLFMLCRTEGISRAELARKLGCHRAQVNRLFNLTHQSRLDKLEDAFAALDASVTIRPPFPADREPE